MTSTASNSNKERVFIFDTTLRDGEQSPGISLNAAEKVEIAQQLARLGVDVIEAGFPIASPGDFEAVRAIARKVEGPVICGLARTHKADIDAALNDFTKLPEAQRAPAQSWIAKAKARQAALAAARQYAADTARSLGSK